MSDAALNIERGITLDLLDQQQSGPALSSTSDMPVVETRPDAQNEGAPPAAAPTEAEAPATEEAEQPEESATSATDEQSGEPAEKKPRGVQKALDRLTAEREEQRKLAEANARRLDEALEIIKQLRPQQQPQGVDVPAGDQPPERPNRADYPDAETFAEAVMLYTDAKIEYNARQADMRVAQERYQREREVVGKAWEEKSAKFKEVTPDYAEVAARSDVEVPMPIVPEIFKSDNGPQILYYLGKNPEEAKRLFTLNERQLFIELGRIEAKAIAAISPPPQAPAIEKPQPAAKPKPINPITPGTEVVRTDPESESPEQYAARRRKEAGWADPQAKRGARH
jgi:hypothetical protein